MQIEQYCDHFGFGNTNTFQQRYLLHEIVGARCLLMYPGNEADIENFAFAAGFVWKLGVQLGCSVVFAEHRGYGTSLLPGGWEQLSSQQALADFAELGSALRSRRGQVPLVVIGGSYGGMLAAWLRTKFPHLFAAAVASSAPVAAFTGGRPVGGFYDVVARVFAPCAADMQAAFRMLIQLGTSPAGCAVLSQTFDTCQPLTPSLVPMLVAFLQAQFGTFAQLNYPYAVSFFNNTLPAHPVKVSCSHFQLAKAASGGNLLTALAASVRLGGPKRPACIPVAANQVEALLPGLLPGAWTYQRCSELVLPASVEAGNPMLLPCSEVGYNCWNLTRFAAFCQESYHVTPRPTFAPLWYSEFQQPTGSNIIWTNGKLDPWHAGSIFLNDTALNITSLLMDGAAHHLDLRADNPADPPSVVSARAFVTSSLASILGLGLINK